MRKSIGKKIILILLIILSFNIITPIHSNAITESIIRKGVQTFLVEGIDSINRQLAIMFSVDAKWEGIKRDSATVWADFKNLFHVNDNGKHDSGSSLASSEEEKTFIEKLDEALTKGENLADDIKKAYYNTLLSPEDIFTGNVKIVDANIFDQKDTSGYRITSFGNIMYVLKVSVASVYYITRNLALVILLCLLIYTGIRIVMASNNAGEKAKWQMYLMDWLKALALVMFVHVLMIGIFYIAEVLMQALMGSLTHDQTIVSAIRQGFSDSLTSFLDTASGWTYIIMYLYVTYLTIVFLIAYFKRLIYLMILIILAPIMSAMYAFGKTTKQNFTKWFDEFTFGVMIQPFHVLIYTVLILLPLTMLQKGNITHSEIPVIGKLTDTFLSYTSIDIQLYALFSLSMIRPIERYVRRLFGFEKSRIDNLASYESGKKTLDTGKKVAEKVVKDVVMIGATIATAGAAAPALGATATTASTASTAANAAGTAGNAANAANAAGNAANAAEAGETANGVGELTDLFPGDEGWNNLTIEDENWLNSNMQPDDAMYANDEYYWPSDEDEPQLSGERNPELDYMENEDWLNNNIQPNDAMYADDKIPLPSDKDAPQLSNNEGKGENNKGENDKDLVLDNANVQINQPNSMHVDSIGTMEADSVSSMDTDAIDSGDIGEIGGDGKADTDATVMDNFKNMLRGMPLASALGSKFDQLREASEQIMQNPYIAAATSPETREKVQDIKGSLHEFHDTFYMPGEASGDWKTSIDYKKEEIKKQKESVINKFANDPKNIEKAIEKYGLKDKHNSAGEVTKTAQEQAKEKLKGMGDYVTKGIIDIDKIDILQKSGLSPDSAIKAAGRHAVSGTVRYESFTKNQQNVNQMATIVADKLNIPQEQRRDPKIIQQINEQVNQRFQEGAKYITTGAARDSKTLDRLMELERKIDKSVSMGGTAGRSKSDYVVNADKVISEAIRKGQKSIKLPNKTNNAELKKLEQIMNRELKERQKVLRTPVTNPRTQPTGNNPRNNNTRRSTQQQGLNPGTNNNNNS